MVGAYFKTAAGVKEWSVDSADDVEAAMSIVRVLFKRRDLFLMLLTRSQGSKRENIKDEFVSFVEDHYVRFAKQFQRISGKSFKGDKVIHWIAHNLVDVFVYLLEHCRTEKEAAERIPSIVSCLTAGWYALYE